MRKTIILTLMFLGVSVSAFGAQDTRIDDFIRWLKGLSADIFAEDMTLEECKGLVKSEYGRTALITAASKGHTEIVDLLFKAGISDEFEVGANE